MKTTVYLSLFIAFALLVSCKKSDKKADVPTPVKKLKYLTRITQVQNNTTTITDYTYDNKKRISVVKDSNGQTTYTYSGNNLFSVEVIIPSIGYRETTEYTYNTRDTVLSADVKQYTNGTLTTKLVYTYFFTNGRLTEVHHDIYVDKYIYDDRGNLISADGSVTYDDKPNIYTNGSPTIGGFPVSPNNVTRRGPAIYTYTYDDDGYPISAIETGQNIQTTKYAYTYTEM